MHVWSICRKKKLDKNCCKELFAKCIFCQKRNYEQYLIPLNFKACSYSQSSSKLPPWEIWKSGHN